VLFSHNRPLLAAAANAACFQGVSNLDQWALTQVLTDGAFLAAYLASVRRRLALCCRGLEAAAAAIGAPLAPCRGAHTAWLDLRARLAAPTWEAEQALWEDLFRRSRVLLTAGRSCGSRIPGFFRVCFAWPAATEEDPAAAMRELARRLVRHFAEPAGPAEAAAAGEGEAAS
jgi:bifunctional pyridoxal-dependent enzyme with beta-cystathionase and maltose regulon repressor activities